MLLPLQSKNMLTIDGMCAGREAEMSERKEVRKRGIKWNA
jgi:hypothetical protein